MKVIESMDALAYKYLDDVNLASWSRHAFSAQSKSDMLLNNLADTFNAWIKESKDKPLLTMLEMIRRQLMTRFQQKKDGIRFATHKIYPKFQKKLERSKDEVRNCICRW
jgi:hypothetical protein